MERPGTKDRTPPAVGDHTHAPIFTVASVPKDGVTSSLRPSLGSLGPRPLQLAPSLLRSITVKIDAACSSGGRAVQA